MEFKEQQAIYLQIAEYVCEKILLENWKPDEKILSVRELAVELEVNPNTAMRAYEFLQNREIIYNKRGIGFFVASDANKKVSTFRKQQFLESELPVFLKNMQILNISIQEIERYYTKFLNNKKS
ncbi:MAG: GntR family transcriptional regulator [Bacteroidetes bacterium]|nr:GntR family transcriptional regulator [Bacteroidota bacterium]